MQKNERHWPRGSSITVAITVDGEPPEHGLRARVEEMRFGPDGVATHVQLTMQAPEAMRLASTMRAVQALANSCTLLLEELQQRDPRRMEACADLASVVHEDLKPFGYALSWLEYEDMESSGEPPEEQA